MTEENKFGTKETEDCLNYADAILDSLKEKKSDDGKIDAGEIAMAMGETAPQGVEALWGITEVDDELKNLNEEERAKLGKKALPLALKLVKLFMP